MEQNQQGQAGIEVSDAMMKAGEVVLIESGRVENSLSYDRLLVRKIYIAMENERTSSVNAHTKF